MKPVIVVECDNDELLLLTLGVPRKRVQHEGNRDEVVKYILKHDPEKFIGLVDQDPGTPRSEKRAQFKTQPASRGLHVERFGKRELVVLRPFLEGWLCEAVPMGADLNSFRGLLCSCHLVPRRETRFFVCVRAAS